MRVLAFVLVALCASPMALAQSSASMTQPMPFTRAVTDPIIFPNVTTTPQQFAISKPPNATTYRFTNPCDVDVRIKKVGSLTETVTSTTGILYLARTSETIGTSQPTFVSIMAMSAPSKPCAPELLYGSGS